MQCRQNSIPFETGYYSGGMGGKEKFMEFRGFLLKYAEIGVKGRNRYIFEDALVRQIRSALRRCE